MESKFKNWKCRCSSLGHLMVKENGMTEKQLLSLNELQERKDKANSGECKPLTQAMEDTLKDLIAKRDAPDELSKGAMTFLDEVFREEFWGRKRQVFTKFMDKGNLQESDSLQLLSDVDKKFYKKNNEHISNSFIQGTPDNRQWIIRDTKTSWDLESFDKAESTHLYEWQIKGYCWIDKKKHGELVYCLVNNPFHQIVQEINRIRYQMNLNQDPDTDYLHPKLVEAKRQAERNMIFDIEAFKKSDPGYIWENEELNFSIPKKRRVKKFKVTLDKGDSAFIMSRIKLARKYLMQKEKQELKFK